MPAFVVDQDHLGPDEGTWLDSPTLSSLAPLRRPSARRVVVVAPHPDDETLGAGGLLQALAGAGMAVEILAVTDGEAFDRTMPTDEARRTRTSESVAALARLGVSAAGRHRLRFPDGEVGDHELRLAELVADRLGPDSMCLAPWEQDGHPDHDACGRAAGAAADACGVPLLRYLVWAWHWAQPSSPEVPWAACRRWALTEEQSRRKRRAIEAFVSQTRRPVGVTGSPVLPPAVLRRFRRPFEVYVA